MTGISRDLAHHLQNMADSSYNNWGRGGHAVPHWLEVILVPLFQFGVPIIIVSLGVYQVIKFIHNPMRGPSLAATAEIVALTRSRFMLGALGSQCKPYRIGLTVKIPGRETYDVTIRQNFEPWALAFVVQVGVIVPVQVQVANPQNVRINLNQAIPPRNVQWGGWPLGG